jgi:hypothetical protein
MGSAKRDVRQDSHRARDRDRARRRLSAFSLATLRIENDNEHEHDRGPARNRGLAGCPALRRCPASLPSGPFAASAANCSREMRDSCPSIVKRSDRRRRGGSRREAGKRRKPRLGRSLYPFLIPQSCSCSLSSLISLRSAERGQRRPRGRSGNSRVLSKIVLVVVLVVVFPPFHWQP